MKYLVTNDYAFRLPNGRFAVPGTVIEATEQEVAGQEFKLRAITEIDELNEAPPRRKRGRPPLNTRDMVAMDSIGQYETK